ncbi:PREDICTED: uncharacterized protein LOC108567649 [Nicrophorus vespilloides]|uniref:Uncharacterized protein LOC108567649 n=1 Tax=Nicrophorus vespilloides TaxID=110193 RepID=A0ABM1NA81_NICVS|nr:PREDICTED: uncharacterized protein LOC108567649 [Nicrophorus vespilloides]
MNSSKMVKICCVIGCSTKQGDGIMLRRFPPIGFPQFEQWKIATRNPSILNKDYKYIKKNKRVCNLHFKETYRDRVTFLKHDIPFLTENVMEMENEESNVVAASCSNVGNNLINSDQYYCEAMSIVNQLDSHIEDVEEKVSVNWEGQKAITKKS